MTHLQRTPHRSELIESLFPTGVLTAQLVGEGNRACLLPEELALISGVAPRRAADFIAGRCCARFLLAQLGLEHIPVLTGPDREPLWPDRIAGSITHTRGFCGVVIAERMRFKSIGLDTESSSAVDADILHHVCTPQEAEWLEGLPPAVRGRARSLVFSAKEAFFKCQFPLTGAWVGFEEVAIRLDSDVPSEGGELFIQPLRSLAMQSREIAGLTCRYRFHDEWISVGVSLANQ
jgi:4'-phosphopantetheinyl transferase EntD